MTRDIHRLTIVIPALDEAFAIDDTIRRCLEARNRIIRDSAITEVELIVVSDGSSDETEPIACRFEEVTVLAFDKNRGYGAAIKTGFEYSKGDVLAFLDADGTCDPFELADMCRALVDEDADVVVGSRVGPGSRMPAVRVIGNTLFAWLLGLLSKTWVRDTASGMRVLRRSSLCDLYPLPDGLHFTPAMTARVLLEDKLKLVEVPITYADRVGESKLAVMQDGMRFLTAIVKAALCYRPARPLLVAAGAIGSIAALIGFLPATFYVQNGRLEEWMIYRILLASLLVTVSAFIICTAVTADRIAAAAHGRDFGMVGVTAAMSRLFRVRARRIVSAILLAAAIAISWPGIMQLLSTGQVTMHWSRAVMASQLALLAVMQALTTFILETVDLIERQRDTERHTLTKPDRLRRAVESNS